MRQSTLALSYLLSRTSWYVVLFKPTETEIVLDFEIEISITFLVWFFMQDISLGVSLGSATQISMFVVRL